MEHNYGMIPDAEEKYPVRCSVLLGIFHTPSQQTRLMARRTSGIGSSFSDLAGRAIVLAETLHPYKDAKPLSLSRE